MAGPRASVLYRDPAEVVGTAGPRPQYYRDPAEVNPYAAAVRIDGERDAVWMLMGDSRAFRTRPATPFSFFTNQKRKWRMEGDGDHIGEHTALASDVALPRVIAAPGIVLRCGI